MEEEQERGWRSIDKNICVDCVHEPALKRIIEENAIEAACDYCGRDASEKLAVCDSDDVMDAIGEGFHYEYSDPVNELGWDEGEYVGVHFDTNDLVARLGEDIGTDDFVQDVVAAFGDSAWCERDYYGTKEDEALVFSWERFAEVVKYERRYLFLKLDEHDEYSDAYDVTPAKMLTRIGELIARHQLVKTLAPGTVVFRGRPHTAAEAITSAVDLGTPPRERAMSNRMSPAGIPVFYGAFDQATTVAEIAPTVTADKDSVSIGEFVTRDELRVVGLAALPPIPSLFDEDARAERPTLRFLHQFARIVSEPAGAGRAADREIVDYIPTQVVTEYLWHAFGDEHDAGRIDGILYGSAQRDQGVCCALFVPRDNCVEPGENPDDAEKPAVELRSAEVVRDVAHDL
jgi:hypothetical protein